MSNSKLYDSNSSFSLLRTNPKLTGNIKITIDSSGGVWFNSIDANKTLSSDRFKKFNITGENSYSIDLFNYLEGGSLSPDIVFEVFNQKNGTQKTAENFKDQYDFFYGSGASLLIDKNYTENFSYFQPLWIKKEIPDFFVIFKVPDPLSYPYTKDNSSNIVKGIRYKVIQDYDSPQDFIIRYGEDSLGNPVSYKNGDIFTGLQNIGSVTVISGNGKIAIFNELEYLKESEDVEKVFKETILPYCSVIKTFDLRETSKIGKYIRSILNDPGFSESPIDINWGSGSYSYFNGVSYSEGIFTKKSESLNSFFTSDSSDPMIDFEDYITSGFYRNGVICPNLLNLEFLFDDEDSCLYSINRYFGFYVSRNDIASFRLNGDFFYKYQNEEGNINSPKYKVNNRGYYYSNISTPLEVPCDSSSGIKLYYQDGNGYLPGVRDVSSINDYNKLFYITDKYDNFYSLKRDPEYKEVESFLITSSSTNNECDCVNGLDYFFGLAETLYVNLNGPSLAECADRLLDSGALQLLSSDQISIIVDSGGIDAEEALMDPFFDSIRNIEIPKVCCSGCNIWIISSVETFLKYAEYVEIPNLSCCTNITASVETFLKYAEAVPVLPSEVGEVCGETYEGYGYLYNWSAIFGAGAQTNGGRNVGGIVNTSQPYSDNRNQWRVPSDADWTTLTTYLGGEPIAGGKLKTTSTFALTTSTGLWEAPNTGATNEESWSGIPGGYRQTDGSFAEIGNDGSWWSSTGFTPSDAWSRFMYYNLSSVGRVGSEMAWGFSLRLVRPATTAELSIPDGTTSNENLSIPHYIGNSRTYITVKIGNQIWTAQNLIDDKYNNGVAIPEVTDNTAWSTLTTGARCSYNNGSITPDQGQIELCGMPGLSPTLSLSCPIGGFGECYGELISWVTQGQTAGQQLDSINRIQDKGLVEYGELGSCEGLSGSSLCRLLDIFLEIESRYSGNPLGGPTSVIGVSSRSEFIDRILDKGIVISCDGNGGFLFASVESYLKYAELGPEFYFTQPTLTSNNNIETSQFLQIYNPPEEFRFGPYDSENLVFLNSGSFYSSGMGKLSIANRKIDLLNFTGTDSIIGTIPGRIPESPGNPHIEIEFLKPHGLEKTITFKVYWPNGSVQEGFRRYDIIQSNDLSLDGIWIGGSYYVDGNTYYFNSKDGTTEDIANSISSVFRNFQNSNWDVGKIDSYSVIRLGDNGLSFNFSYSISIFDNYEEFSSKYKGNWNSLEFYLPNDIVFYNGYYYYSGSYLPPDEYNYNGPGTYNWILYQTFSDPGYIKINGIDASEIRGPINFKGGSDKKDCQVIFENRYLDLVNSGNFLKVVNGFSEILEVSKYVGEPILDPESGEVIYFKDFDSFYVATLSDQNSIIELGSDNSFTVYGSKKLNIGVFSFFDVKEFDFDFWSSPYSNTPTPEFHRYYKLISGQRGAIKNGIPYIVKEGSISYNGNSYSQGDVFYGATGSSFFENEEDSLIDPTVFPIYYSNLSNNGTNFYPGRIGYYEDLEEFKGFIGIQEISNKLQLATNSKEEFLNLGKLENEYEYLKENFTTQRSNISRIVPYINKWRYYEGTDGRGNPYRLNSSPAFTPTNFSPSLDKIDIDPEYMTQEWFLLESPPIDYPLDEMKNQNNYLPRKLDIEKIKNSDPLYSDYFLKNFTVSPEDYDEKNSDLSDYTKEFFTNFKYNKITGYYETLFRGIKIILKKRSNLSKSESQNADQYVSGYSGYENYKFSAILRLEKEKEETINPPLTYEVIENTQQRSILFICTLFIKDQRVLPLGSTGSEEPRIDYLTLYSAKNKIRLTGIPLPLVGQPFNTNDDIKLSVPLDLSLTSGSLVNSYVSPGIINSFPSEDYEVDLRDEINLFYPANSGGPSIPSFGPGSFSVPAGGYSYPWPVGVGPSYVEFGQVSIPYDYTFSIPFSTYSPADVPIGVSSFYESFPVFQLEGGLNYFSKMLKRCTSSYISKKVNERSKYIKYKTYYWDDETSEQLYKEDDFELYFESPTKFLKSKGSYWIDSNSGPKELNQASFITSYNIINSDPKYSSILTRYSGPYEPIFRKVIHFDRDKTDTIVGSGGLIDLSFRNCNFSPGKRNFGISKNLSYIKVSGGSPILSLSSSLPEGPVYPLIGQTPIDIRDFNVFSSNWDPGYYYRYTSSINYNKVAGTRSMYEGKNLMGSKVMKTPNTVNSDNYITLQISRTLGSNDVSYLNSLIDSYIKPIQSINDQNSGNNIGSVGIYRSNSDYDKLDLSIFKNAEILWQNFKDQNSVKGIIRLDRILRRSLLNEGVKKVFLDNIISEFGIGDPSSIDDDVNSYLEQNILPSYEGGSFELYSKKTADPQFFSSENELIRGDLSYNDMIKRGYILEKNYSLTKISNLIYWFDFKLDSNFNYSFQFNFDIKKI